MALVDLALATEYRTGQNNPVVEFYEPCLNHARKYRRAVGFFRSSVFYIVGPAIIDFAKNGGIIKLICSPDLTDEDYLTIESNSGDVEEILSRHLVAEIDKMLELDSTAYSTKILATLIKTGVLEVRIALRPSDMGPYHEKIGIFSDTAGDLVSFIGSANETWKGWHQKGNFESIEVFCSWRNESEKERTVRHKEYFDRIWEGLVPNLSIVKFPEAARLRIEKSSFEDLEDIELDKLAPPEPKRKPFPHQATAIANWLSNGKRGVFDHATGSGKTFPALLIIKKHIEEGKPAIVLVPSRLLLEQWADEINSDIPHATLLLAGAGNTKWKTPGRLKTFSSPASDLGPRIILSTMQTAASERFRNEISEGAHLLIVADEVHQIGSSFNAQSMTLATGARLGLSATPNRYGDPEGTTAIFDYFGPVVPPKFSLEDAIKSKRLVEYEYYPRPIHLTNEEATDWSSLTRTIIFEVGKLKKDKNGNKLLTDKIKLLLIKRSRIAKKAYNKIELANQILLENYEEGQHWLVYCEDQSQLNEVKDSLQKNGLRPVEYHTSMPGDMEATLSWFKNFGGILISIRCLDEGVDIPNISHAIILASSQNPRQFIQRRGRVLRTAVNKRFAVIYDAIVVPINTEEESDQIALLKNELARAIEFSDYAINRSAGAELRKIATTLGIDIDSLKNHGIEED
jgi:superfamily II DNA or RNA helicase